MKKNLISLLIVMIAVFASSCEKEQFVREYKSRWIKVKHTPLEKVTIPERATIEADIEVPPNVRSVEAYLIYKRLPGGSPFTIVMERSDNHFFAEIPNQTKGTKIEYFIDARGDNDLALRIPSASKGFQLVFQARPQPALLTAHVVTMMISLAFFISSGLLSIKAIRKRKTTPSIARAGFMGLVFFIVSAIPLGMIVAYQTFGTPWSGFPVGNDITDNKSLAIIIYFIMASILYRGSLFQNDPNLDRLPIRAMPVVYLVGVIITLVLFAIPH